jgi:hypothetical protein
MYGRCKSAYIQVTSKHATPSLPLFEYPQIALWLLVRLVIQGCRRIAETIESGVLNTSDAVTGLEAALMFIVISGALSAGSYGRTSGLSLCFRS